MNDKFFNFQEAKQNGYNFVIEIQTEVGEFMYPNLQTAQAVFKDLDLNRNGKRFTWGMYGGFNKHYDRHIARFEEHSIYQALSS